MDIVISDESLQATTKCKKGFSCLKGNRKDLCKVESCIDEKIHFIKCLNSKHCFYQASYGGSHYCSCPARKEIYNKYNI